MGVPWAVKHFLELRNHSKDILEELIDGALDEKKNRLNTNYPLKSLSILLLFEKPSVRTRVSFEVGAYELGAQSLYLNPESIQMGQRESIEDVSRVLSSYGHMVVLRTFSHETLLKFAQFSHIPVINGLTDQFHPCQIMADMMTVKEHYTDWKDRKIVYVGCGNNILNSWLYAAALLGLNFVYSTPKKFRPSSDIETEVKQLCQANSSYCPVYCEDPQEAVLGADILYTDVWVSMGQKDDENDKDIFQTYQVNDDLMSLAHSEAKFMHCLPAHRGKEVISSILDSERSLVFHQAENRLHIQKAIMRSLCKV